MKREAAALSLGAWLMGTIAVTVVATQDFYMVDRLLRNRDNTTFSRITEQIGPDASRDFLRYLSSELNRLFFQIWNYAQLIIGTVVLWLVVGIRQAPQLKWFVIIMLVIVVFLTVWITPQILMVGRALDFVPRDPPPPNLNSFNLLHGAYTSLELVKFVIGISVSIWILRLSRTQV